MDSHSIGNHNDTSNIIQPLSSDIANQSNNNNNATTPQIPLNPYTQFRQNLPIFEYIDRIQSTVANNNVCIITGDTGSGKSTQLPQYMMDSQIVRKSLEDCYRKWDEGTNYKELGEQKTAQKGDSQRLEATNHIHPNNKNSKQIAPNGHNSHPFGKFDKVNVIITQPRRMAAVSMAHRVATQRGCQVGQQVGYTIRFQNKTSRNTRLRYITDGIFVRQCINDPYLLKYHVVILDEAHERSLYTDILFALIKKALEYRKGTLKLIVTSATLNTKIFSSYYNKCPVIQMHGKLFPVQVKYSSINHANRVQQCVKAAIRLHLHEGPGDILVFLTGSQECVMATHMCEDKLQSLMQKGKDVPGMVMYQLYGSLSIEEQARAFQRTPDGIRKVVFCTNIAQTSLTIDNIGFVIDCGYAKQKTFNPKTNMDLLVTVPISKVQAIQRKGRAGRTRAGRCLRMYSQKFYEEMADYSLPEILRVSLNNVILTLKSMKIRDVINFEYMENPDKQAILKALSDLYLLDALDQNGNITDLGIQMSKFPLQPQFSKAVITSSLLGCRSRMVALVSMLSTEGIWKKVLRLNQEEHNTFLEKKKLFLDQTGDHETLLKAYQAWTKCANPDEFCTENFFNFRALRQTDNIVHQLQDLLETCNLRTCEKAFMDDANYQEYKEIKKQYKNKMPVEYTSTLVRRSLAVSFYFNTARISADQSTYLLNYPDGTPAAMDTTCALALQQLDTPCLLFTELSGSGAKCVMYSVSRISQKWISSYLPKIRKIDVFRLAGIDLNPERLMAAPKKELTPEEKKLFETKERERKIVQAKQRYFARKKVKVQ